MWKIILSNICIYLIYERNLTTTYQLTSFGKRLWTRAYKRRKHGGTFRIEPDEGSIYVQFVVLIIEIFEKWGLKIRIE